MVTGRLVPESSPIYIAPVLLALIVNEASEHAVPFLALAPFQADEFEVQVEPFIVEF